MRCKTNELPCIFCNPGACGHRYDPDEKMARQIVRDDLDQILMAMTTEEMNALASVIQKAQMRLGLHA